MNIKLQSSLAFIVALFASNPCLASDEINIFQQGGTWYLQSMDRNYSEERLAIKGDTTLCGHECQQVWSSKNGSEEKLAACIYTEGDKVYFVKSDKMHLMYDFGLQPDDTTHVDLLNDKEYENNTERYVKCKKRYTVKVNGCSYEAMEMADYYYDPEKHHSDNGPISKFTWIVGVGTNFSPFHNMGYDFVIDGRGSCLRKAKLGDEVLYDPYADKYDKYNLDLVTPLASLETYEVNCTAAFTWNNDYRGLEWEGMMGIDGDDVYVQGMCEVIPEAWVKGSLSANGVVTFKSQQCIGYKAIFADDDYLSGPFFFANANLDPTIAMAWDAETRTLECHDYSYLARFMDDNYYVLDLYNNVTITPKYPVHIAVPTSADKSSDATYNIYGTRVEGSPSGLTIRNGRIEFRR